MSEAVRLAQDAQFVLCINFQSEISTSRLTIGSLQRLDWFAFGAAMFLELLVRNRSFRQPVSEGDHCPLALTLMFTSRHYSLGLGVQKI